MWDYAIVNNKIYWLLNARAVTIIMLKVTLKLVFNSNLETINPYICMGYGHIAMNCHVNHDCSYVVTINLWKIVLFYTYVWSILNIIL